MQWKKVRERFWTFNRWQRVCANSEKPLRLSNTSDAAV